MPEFDVLDYSIAFAETGDTMIEFSNGEQILVSECPSYFGMDLNYEVTFEDAEVTLGVGRMPRREYAILSAEFSEFLEN